MKLREWLSANGFTNSSFAEIIGVHPSTIARICRGQYPERKTALAIIEATKGAVVPEDFLEGKRDEKLLDT